MPDVTFTITRDQLTSIASLGYCASADDFTPVITGVLITVNPDGSLVAVATDRYVVAELIMSTEETDATEPTSAIVPAKWLLAAAKSVKGGARDGGMMAHITISHSEAGAVESVTITNWDTTVKTATINGNYPQVSRLFPDDIPDDVDNFIGFNLNPHKLMQIAKVIPAGMSSREMKDAPLFMRASKAEGGHRAPVIVTRPRVNGFRALIQPNLILS